MNWKTTLSGIAFVGALCTFLVSLIPTMAQGLPWLVVAQPYLAMIAAIAGFVNAYFQKDKDVTGGSRQAGHAVPAILLAIFFASFLAILLTAPTVRAAPYLICDPYPTTASQPTEFSVAVDGAAAVTSSAQTLTDGSKRLHYDLAAVATGAHSVTYKPVLVDPYWGRLEGPASDPFAFTKPGAPAKGTGTALAP